MWRISFFTSQNKPLQLKDGTLLCPASGKRTEGKEEDDWTCWVDESKDGGLTWTKYGPIELDGKVAQVITYKGSHLPSLHPLNPTLVDGGIP